MSCSVVLRAVVLCDVLQSSSVAQCSVVLSSVVVAAGVVCLAQCSVVYLQLQFQLYLQLQCRVISVAQCSIISVLQRSILFLNFQLQLSIYRSIYLSICRPICLSVYLKFENKAFVREFLKFLKLTTSRMQQLCQASLNLTKVKNETSLRDFLNFRSCQHQKRSNSARLPPNRES